MSATYDIDRLIIERDDAVKYAILLHRLALEFCDAYNKEFYCGASVVEKWPGWIDGHNTAEPEDVAYLALRAALAKNPNDGAAAAESPMPELLVPAPVTNAVELTDQVQKEGALLAVPLEWFKPGAVVPINAQTTGHLLRMVQQMSDEAARRNGLLLTFARDLKRLTNFSGCSTNTSRAAEAIIADDALTVLRKENGNG